MNTGLKIGLGIGAAVVVGAGLRYGYTRDRLVKNLTYRPEINIQKSSLQVDKLILSVNLFVNNPTPNKITITKPTITLRYPRPQRVEGQDEDVPFDALPSDSSITINGNGQTTISDIRIEIIYSDTLSVGKDIVEKLLKCEKVEMKVDVAMTVDSWYFLSKKNIKTILIERKDIPSRLSNLLPPCGSAAGKIVADLITGKVDTTKLTASQLLDLAYQTQESGYDKATINANDARLTEIYNTLEKKRLPDESSLDYAKRLKNASDNKEVLQAEAKQLENVQKVQGIAYNLNTMYSGENPIVIAGMGLGRLKRRRHGSR